MNEAMKQAIAATDGTTMFSPPRLLTLYLLLTDTIAYDVPGEVVEAGCNSGMSTTFLRQTLDFWKSTKEFHAYDSFEGLVDYNEKDIRYGDGMMAVEEESLYTNFRNKGLVAPIVHRGKVQDTMPSQLPPQIAFVHCDVDLYLPTLHVLDKVYDRLSPLATVVVDDYHHPHYPGIARAVHDFLEQHGDLDLMNLDLKPSLLEQHQVVLRKRR